MLSVPKRANDAMHLAMLEGKNAVHAAGYRGYMWWTLSARLRQASRRTWRCRVSWSCRTVSRSGTRGRLSERDGTGTSSCLSSRWSSARSLKTPLGEPSTSTRTDYWWVWFHTSTAGVALLRAFTIRVLLQTSELGVTEHIEGDPCKFALWSGRTPSSDNKTVLKVSADETPVKTGFLSAVLPRLLPSQASSMEAKQEWIKNIREVIQERMTHLKGALKEPLHLPKAPALTKPKNHTKR